MSRFGKIQFAAILLMAGWSATSYAGDPSRLHELIGCYQQLRPFSTTGEHAIVYPGDQNLIFIPGKYDGKDGVYFYSDQGVSFFAISADFSKKPIAFNISSKKGPMSVVYQPVSPNRRPQVWLRAPLTTKTTGVTAVFQNSDDLEKRAPLVGDLREMVGGMARTWDVREDQLVQAVEEGKYLWVEVDLEHYKDAAHRCQALLGSSGELTSLRSAIQNELEDLNNRAARTGVVHDERAPTTGFMTTPQY